MGDDGTDFNFFPLKEKENSGWEGLSGINIELIPIDIVFTTFFEKWCSKGHLRLQFAI